MFVFFEALSPELLKAFLPGNVEC